MYYNTHGTCMLCIYLIGAYLSSSNKLLREGYALVKKKQSMQVPWVSIIIHAQLHVAIMYITFSLEIRIIRIIPARIRILFDIRIIRKIE